jgi:GNAT superfamily N-acetyltransferase
MTFRIRHLSPDDYPLVISVIDQWWGGRPTAGTLPRLFFEHFTGTSFAAERDGSLAGFLAGFISQSRPGEAYIHFVGVDPAERGGGLGRLLYQAFFRAAQARGCTLVRAVTSPVNRGSVAFHQRMGFRLEPGDAEVDGIPVSCGYDGPGSDRVRFLRILPRPFTYCLLLPRPAAGIAASPALAVTTAARADHPFLCGHPEHVSLLGSAPYRHRVGARLSRVPRTVDDLD